MSNISGEIRHNWAHSEIKEIHDRPLLELVFEAASVHRQYHDPRSMQVSALLSVKTGGCTEDCKYCSQSSYYKTEADSEEMLAIEQILEAASRAKKSGASRFCLGTAWRNIPDAQMDEVVAMVHGVKELGLEVCATMGSVTPVQAQKLKEAGLDAYNHNLDTGRDFYNEIITTRDYEERLETLHTLQEADIDLCSGGILGMGESVDDRVDMLKNLANLPRHPGSVPINILVPIEGTPIARDENFQFFDLLRAVATARIIMPTSRVRLSAGRNELSEVEQAFCFLAGANSVFSGEKLLTTDNVNAGADQRLFEMLGLYAGEKAISLPS